MSKVLEIFGEPTFAGGKHDWRGTLAARRCPFLERACLKNRKSHPETLIGTCAVAHGRDAAAIVICPHRLLERRQIFTDCLPLLTLHEPGNEFHIVPEVTVPGGSVDYFLASVRKGKVRDFVGVELQTMDTTGAVWPERQRFLKSVGLRVDASDVASAQSFGINWKMTAKTILVQLHHKIETFEHMNKHLVLAVQDHLLDYMQKVFDFGHFHAALRGDPMHLHAYRFSMTASNLRLDLAKQMSTDAAGVSACLGLRADPKADLDLVLTMLEAKISEGTRFSFGPISDQTPATKPS